MDRSSGSLQTFPSRRRSCSGLRCISSRNGRVPREQRREVKFRLCSVPEHYTATEFLRSEEHTSELQSLRHLVCRLLLEKKKNNKTIVSSSWIYASARVQITPSTSP